MEAYEEAKLKVYAAGKYQENGNFFIASGQLFSDRDAAQQSADEWNAAGYSPKVTVIIFLMDETVLAEI